MADFPPGRYQVRILDTALTQSKNGNDQVVVRFEPAGQYDGAGAELYELDDAQRGQSRRAWLTLTDATRERRMAELLALAPEMEDVTQFDRESAGGRFIDLAGRECDMTCRYDTFQGRTTEKWEMAVGGPGRPITDGNKPTAAALGRMRAETAAAVKQLKAQRKEPF